MQEMAKLNTLMDRVMNAADITDNSRSYPARRCLANAQHDLESAEMWLQKAVSNLSQEDKANIKKVTGIKS